MKDAQAEVIHDKVDYCFNVLLNRVAHPKHAVTLFRAAVYYIVTNKENFFHRVLTTVRNFDSAFTIRYSRQSSKFDEALFQLNKLWRGEVKTSSFKQNAGPIPNVETIQTIIIKYFEEKLAEKFPFEKFSNLEKFYFLFGLHDEIKSANPIDLIRKFQIYLRFNFMFNQSRWGFLGPPNILAAVGGVKKLCAKLNLDMSDILFTTRLNYPMIILIQLERDEKTGKNRLTREGPKQPCFFSELPVTCMSQITRRLSSSDTLNLSLASSSAMDAVFDAGTLDEWRPQV